MKKNITLFILMAVTMTSLSQAQLWESANNGLSVPRISDIAVNANSQSFVSLANGTVYRSDDSGSTWSKIFSQANKSEFFTPIGVQPTTQYVFATSDYGEVFRSTNNGTNWTQVRNVDYISLWQFGFSPMGDIYLAAGLYGDSGRVYKSTNNGTTWFRLGFNNTGGRVHAVVVHPDGRVYIGTDNNGVYMSTDGGAGWIPKNTGLPSTTSSFARKIYITNDGTLLINMGGSGLYRSANGGDSWSKVRDGNATALTQNPVNGYLYMGDFNNLYRSTDGGSTWTSIASNMSTTGDVFGSDWGTGLIAFPGGRMMYRDYGGVGYSNDFGATWIKSTTGMEGGMIKNLLARSNGHILATAHTAGIIRSTDGGNTWQKIRDIGGEDYFGIIENPQDQSLWATVVCDGLLQSTNSGNTWTVKNSNLTNTCLRDIGINPSTGAWFVSSDAGLFQSTNSGTSWFSTLNQNSSGMISFKSNGEMYFVVDGIIYKGSADALTWTNITPPFLYSRSVCAAENGWLIASGYGVMKLSQDNGATWTDVYNGNFQFDYVDPQGIIWVGGRSGLVRSLDNGMHWEPISLDGISDPFVTSVIKRNADNRLYIGTYGSGIFRSVQTYQINAVTMSAPANAATGVSRSPVLSCNTVTNASKYQFQISTTSDFSSVVFDSLSVGTTVNVPVQLEAGSQYYTRARGVNDAGAGPWSQTIGFTTVFLTPAFSQTPVYLNQANEGQAFSVSIDSVRNKPSNVYLVYGIAGQETGTDLSMTLSGENFSASVPVQAVTQKGFWFRIKAVNTGGTAYSPSATEMYSVPVQLMTSGIAQVKSSGAYPAGIPTKAYYSLGNPLNTNIDLTLVFGPADPKNWNAWYWNGTQFVETTVMDNTGRGYIIYNQTSATRDIIVTSAVTNTLNKFSDLVLKPGWNVVSWPLSYTANITNRNNASVGSVWSYNGKSGWQAVTQVKPFGAFAIYNRGSSDITAGSAITTGGIAKISDAETNGSIWHMDFTVKAGEYEDRFNRIGVVNEEREVTLLNEPKPVSPGQGLSAYFHDSFRLASDFRKLTSDVHRWEMTIENHTESRQTELSWESLNLPDGQTVKMYDYAYDRVIDLRERTQYELTIDRIHKLAVIAGSSEQVDQDIQKMRSNIPDDFFLSQNYPNPFNPSTTIRFGISKTSYVSLKIFNALGQEVTTLISEVKNPGQYQSIWNGKDRNDRSVASGIYIYRLQADGFTQTRKMLYIR